MELETAFHKGYPPVIKVWKMPGERNQFRFLGVKGGTGVYTIEQIRDKIIPVAEEYGLRRVYLFGSYARREATEDSDVDLLVDAPYGMGLFKSEALRQSFEEALNIHVDILTESGVRAVVKVGNKYLDESRERFRNNIERDKVVLYANNE